jgi:hypothetical protein
MSDLASSPAPHDQVSALWHGAPYELNLAFGSLRDDQWWRVLTALWETPSLLGPLAARGLPSQVKDKARITIPPPTTTFTQYADLILGPEQVVGCSVLVTRSLFECVSIQVPSGMFADLDPGHLPRIPRLEAIFYSLALAIYRQAAFECATIGWERGCVLEAELAGDADLRQRVLSEGGVFITDAGLASIGVGTTRHDVAVPGLRWIAFAADQPDGGGASSSESSAR